MRALPAVFWVHGSNWPERFHILGGVFSALILAENTIDRG